MLFDGLVSSLRTRTAEEILALVYGQERAQNWWRDQSLWFAREQWLLRRQTTSDAIVDGAHYGDDDNGDCWEFQRDWKMHTWPLGWANWLVGVKRRRVANCNDI